jgi:hypothetical protein
MSKNGRVESFRQPSRGNLLLVNYGDSLRAPVRNYKNDAGPVFPTGIELLWPWVKG